jgi:hypothetical protein
MKQTYVKYLRTVYGGERGVDERGNTTTYGEGVHGSVVKPAHPLECGKIAEIAASGVKQKKGG